MDFLDFENHMNKIKEHIDESKDFNEKLQSLFTSSYVYCELGDRILNNFIKLLSEVCNDTNEWIDYYVYECEFGKKDLKVYIGEKDLNVYTEEKTIVLDSVQKLWDLINEV